MDFHEETPAQHLDAMVAAISRKVRMEDLVDNYCKGITTCMEQTGVKLEAAIEMLFRVVNGAVAKIPDGSEEERELVQEGLHAAANEMREALVYARRIVKMDDEGRAEPLTDEEIERSREEFEAKRDEKILAEMASMSEAFEAPRFAGPQEISD